MQRLYDTMKSARQPWIYNPCFDSVFILGIPFFIVALAFALPAPYTAADSMTVVSWAILVMGVDVSHVYSTLYRTYFDRETLHAHRAFLYIVPFAVFVICLALYSFGALVFWRIIAYVAVFHFTRQQYGFVRIYARGDNAPAWQRRLDALAIYTATFYPILAWHLTGPKNFHWFMNGDFVYANCGYLFARPAKSLCFQSMVEPLSAAAWVFYVAVIGAYAAKELFLLWNSIARLWKNRAGTGIETENVRSTKTENFTNPFFNLPKNAIIAGTFLSWYVGIVHFNSDLAFTAINVVSHGIPYIALVWVYGRKKSQQGSGTSKIFRTLFKPRYVALFFGLLFVFAYIEEAFWNIGVWHEPEHARLFAFFHKYLGDIDTASPWLGILVPLLSVPQITHYVIDGFIWKMRKDRFAWRDIILGKISARAATPKA